MSAFLYFSQGRRSKIKGENPDLKNTEISRILGEMWRGSSEEERRPYVDKEKGEREIYKTDMAKWKEEFAAKQEADRHAVSQQTILMMGDIHAPAPPPPPPNPYEHHYPPPPYGYGHHAGYPYRKFAPVLYGLCFYSMVSFTALTHA
jgi:hypothetical protein